MPISPLSVSRFFYAFEMVSFLGHRTEEQLKHPVTMLRKRSHLLHSSEYRSKYKFVLSTTDPFLRCHACVLLWLHLTNPNGKGHLIITDHFLHRKCWLESETNVYVMMKFCVLFMRSFNKRWPPTAIFFWSVFTTKYTKLRREQGSTCLVYINGEKQPQTDIISKTGENSFARKTTSTGDCKYYGQTQHMYKAMIGVEEHHYW